MYNLFSLISSLRTACFFLRSPLLPVSLTPPPSSLSVLEPLLFISPLLFTSGLSFSLQTSPFLSIKASNLPSSKISPYFVSPSSCWTVSPLPFLSLPERIICICLSTPVFTFKTFPTLFYQFFVYKGNTHKHILCIHTHTHIALKHNEIDNTGEYSTSPKNETIISAMAPPLEDSLWTTILNFGFFVTQLLFIYLFW